MVKCTTDATDVLNRFDIMLNLTKNFKPFFKRVVGKENSDIPWTIRGGLKFTFASQKGPKGETWKPLSDQYKKWKDKNYPGRALLELTGTLMQSLYSVNEYTVYSMLPKKLNFGTSLPYGAALHFGNPSRNLPPRPYMGWRPGQEDRVKLELRAYLLEAYKTKRSGD